MSTPAVVLTGGDPATKQCRDVLVDATGRTTILENDAQAFGARALNTSKAWRLGRGRGPVAHLNPPPTKEF